MRSQFPKSERLKSSEQIEALFKRGKSVTCFPLKLFYLPEENTKDGSKIAFSVPKKSFKKAVARNRIKRMLRESYRINKARYFNNIEGKFAFLILYLGKEMPEYTGIENRMNTLFEEFKKTIA